MLVPLGIVLKRYVCRLTIPLSKQRWTITRAFFSTSPRVFEKIDIYEKVEKLRVEAYKDKGRNPGYMVAVRYKDYSKAIGEYGQFRDIFLGFLGIMFGSAILFVLARKDIEKRKRAAMLKRRENKS
uniref:Uncharacterized protein n=1 Tax=Syphacia muris TaxID=451379 RepID=A0A0N5AEX9_9BILA